MNKGNKEVLLVTGGGRGIGAALVRSAAACGYAVCFSYVHDDAAAGALVREIGPSQAHALKGDVADPSFAPRFFTAAEQALGTPVALVNNAGITGHHGAFVDLPLGALRRTLDVNLVGTILTTQEIVRRWLSTGTRGRIVNLSSVAAATGAPSEYVHYAASKGAVEALTIGLGKELAAAGIRVNAVSPGTTQTDIHAAMGLPDRPRQVAARVPMRRVAAPEEIADVVLWLLSPRSSYVTGTVVRAAGGA